MVVGIRTLANQTTNCNLQFHLLWNPPLSTLNNKVSTLDNEVSILDNEVSILDNEVSILDMFNSQSIVDINYDSIIGVSSGLTYTVDNDVVHITGTNAGSAYVYRNFTITYNDNIFSNKKLFVFCERSGNNINSYVQLFWRQDGTNLNRDNIYNSIDLSIP